MSVSLAYSTGSSPSQTCCGTIGSSEPGLDAYDEFADGYVAEDASSLENTYYWNPRRHSRS